ncbi:MAG: hypothetical protein VX938_11915, partial [Myxococcota bacterium]|nr:hypothetical protein [Myxococcota bacterium]
GRIELENDTNQDGALNPGETATVKVYLDNIGQSRVSGLWAELDAVDEGVNITDCQMPGYPKWHECSASCSCSLHSQGATVSVEPGDESDDPVLSMQVEIAHTVEFKFDFSMTIHDDLGRAWERTVTVPIAEPVGSVFVTSTEVLFDSNGDGGVSPGESGSVAVYAKNGGETQVRGLWTRLASMDPNVVVTACYAGVGSSWVACDAACSCEAVVESAKQTLEPMGVTDIPLFRMDFDVSADAPVSPLLLGVEFRDELQAHWVDTVAINLVPPTATLELIHTELLNDANGDGYLSPAESAMIQVFAQNTGITKAVDIWAELVGTSEVVQVEECLVGVGDGWNSCGKHCSCEHALESAKQQLEPGESLDVAIFAVKFKLVDDAPLEPVDFHMLLHDGMGNSWESTASVNVLSPNSQVQIETVALLDDSNGDGFVSPAEDVTIEIRAKNFGTSKSLGVWAYLSEVSEWMTVQSCYAATEGSF